MISSEQPALSLRNPKVQQLRRLIGRRSARSEAGQFVFEGATLALDAVAAGLPLVAAFVDEARADALAEVIETLAALTDVHLLAPGVVDRVADTASPQGLIVVATRPAHTLDSLLAGSPNGLVVVLDDLNDPGNAGAIVRTAEAVGATAVVFAGASTDPFGPKAVRASAGSAFRVPLVDGGPAAQVATRLREGGSTTVGTVASGGLDHREVELTGDVALVLGSEAHGLAPAVVADLDHRVTIPMRGVVESLNVAAVAAVLGYERIRQLDLAAPSSRDDRSER